MKIRIVRYPAFAMVGLPSLAALLGAPVAAAQDATTGEAAPPPAAAAAAPEQPDPKVTQARQLFKQGVAAVRAAQWAEALSFFERSLELRPHATTIFNIGACERALGRYTRAHHTFGVALARGAQHEGELAPGLTTEAQGFVQELQGLFARVSVRLDPPDAAVAVDGRPLSVENSGGLPVLVAGVLPPGPKQAPPQGSFELVVNPGAHVLTLSRKGFTDVVLNYSFAPGERRNLDLNLEHLPAILKVSSNVDGALVSLDGRDMGPAPVDIRRTAGTYQVEVLKDGYEPYQTQVSVNAGEEATLMARMVVEDIPITKRWWFWTGAAAVIATGVLVTYAVTRPEPSPPPYESGNTNWIVTPSGGVEF